MYSPSGNDFQTQFWRRKLYLDSVSDDDSKGIRILEIQRREVE